MNQTILKPAALDSPIRDPMPQSNGGINIPNFMGELRTLLGDDHDFHELIEKMRTYNFQGITRPYMTAYSIDFLRKHPWIHKFIDKLIENKKQQPPPEEKKEEKEQHVSYLPLPPDRKSQVCSGQTALCKEVLNNKWTLAPVTQAIPQKKNCKYHLYEDYICDMDVHLEIFQSFEELLLKAKHKLDHLTLQERNEMKMDATLNGSSRFIPGQALKLLYGESSPKFLHALMEAPDCTVPVILDSLRSKVSQLRNHRRSMESKWKKWRQREQERRSKNHKTSRKLKKSHKPSILNV